MRRIAIALGALGAVVVGVVVYFVFTRFVVYQGSVDRIVVALPSEERDLSAAAIDVIEKLQGNAIPWQVSRSLLAEVAPSDVTMGEWHLRGALWQYLLPLRLRRQELVRLFAHYMVLEGGSGIAYGARHYFAKSPAALTAEEAVSLVTIARAPGMFSPERRPDRYEFMYKKLLARYHAAG